MKKIIICLWVISLFALSSIAQEGLWLLSQIEQLDLESKGLEIKTSDIYDPVNPGLSRAVVQLGGGTASFVSPDGLLITNHHVAFGALQRTSSVNSNYIAEGFLAENRSDEIPAPGYRALLMQEMKDVTDKILSAVKGITDPSERDKKINEKITKMTDDQEKGKPDILATVAENYNGRQYILYIYKEFNDIRIVYAPPSAIGKFGGDIDNWMWPRHTGDFSFMRVYVSPEGNGAEYSENNVPYKPEVWLKVARQDLDEGDFAFVIGYPGSTTRFRTSNSADWNLNINYPFSIDYFGNVIKILEETTADDPEGQIKVAALHSGLNNVLKNYQGKVEGMKKTHFVERKREFEKEFTAWVNGDPDRKAKYGNILEDVEKNYEVLLKTKKRDNVFGMAQGLGGTLTGLAGNIYMYARELDKPKKERDSWATEENLQETIDNLHFRYNNYFEPADKAMLVYGLEMINKLPEDQRIEGLEYIFSDKSVSIEEFVEKAYQQSKLADVEYAKSLLNMSFKELMAQNDPFIKMVDATYELSEEIEKTSDTFASNVTDLRKDYIDALYEWKGTNLYPDANGTIRFTYGQVKGYSPRDAVWYRPFTSLKGVVEKNTGEEPFNVPQDLVKLYKSRDFGPWTDPDMDDVPVAFTHMADITGGNSGSPVMNARGEIIGVVFDGNYEAMISDWQYDYDIQRTISVDIRYVLFVTEKFGRADFLLKELGVR
jgi:hypothetical protein